MYDVVIGGAGPAGLSAAITAAQNGLKAVVIEKGPTAGPEPRGESIPKSVLIEELLGPGTLEKISHFKSTTREFHSPGDLKSSVIKIKEPYYFFEWRKLIDILLKKAEGLGVEFIFNAEVTSVLKKNGIADGLEYRLNGEIREVMSKVVLGCGGRTCPVAAGYGIDTESIACPTVKFLGNNASIDNGITRDLQFYTIQPDSFQSVKGFPPAFAYIFPLEGKKIEAGLMLRLSQLEKLKGVKLPSEEEIAAVWEEAKRELPGFSSFFHGIKHEYLKITSIQNRRMIKNNVMGKGGAVLIGDSIGLVDANGSAGLYYAMAHGKAWIEMLAGIIKSGGPLWEPRVIKEYYRRQAGWAFYKYITRSFSTISIFERMLFKTFGTEKKLNRVWGFIAFILQKAS